MHRPGRKDHFAPSESINEDDYDDDVGYDDDFRDDDDDVRDDDDCVRLVRYIFFRCICCSSSYRVLWLLKLRS